MSFTAAEIRELSAADDERGWSPIPDGCPPQFRQLILETRARRIGLRAKEPTAPVIPAAPAVPQDEVAALRARLQALSI